MKTVKITHKHLAIKVLKHVLNNLKANTYSYGICNLVFICVDHVHAGKRELVRTEVELHMWVKTSLGDWSSYPAWLRENCAEYRTLGYYECLTAVREGRIAWVEWMISELEALIEPEGEKHFPHSRVTLWK